MRPLANIPMHFGQLHAYETALLMLLAFGPLVVAFVVTIVRRRDAADEEVDVEENRASEPDPD